jgi:hypothetical protein
MNEKELLTKFEKLKIIENIQETPSKSLKIKYNEIVQIGKKYEVIGDFKNSLKNYEIAYKIVKNEALYNKITKLKNLLENNDNVDQLKELKINSTEKIRNEVVLKPKEKNVDLKETKKDKSLEQKIDESENQSKDEVLNKNFTFSEKENCYIFKDNKYKIKKDVFEKLYDYQREGISWFCTLLLEKGGILGKIIIIIKKGMTWVNKKHK